jgi:hypothetical protein
MWKNIVERGRPQVTVWRKRIACWTRKATNTHSVLVIFFLFSTTKWLHERASMSRYSTMFVVFVSTDKQVTKQYCYKDFLLNVMTVGGKNSAILWERMFNTYVKGSN